MTRRERMEARADKRGRWADARAAKSAAAFVAADLREERSGIPMGQPVLVGHHSERHHRRAIDRADAAMRRSIEHGAKASEHVAAESTLHSRLDSSIFSDDPTAIADLEARAKAHEAEADRLAAINLAWRRAFRRGGRAAAVAELGAIVTDACERVRLLRAAELSAAAARKGPASPERERTAARRDRERIAQICRDEAMRSRHAAQASAAGGASIVADANGWAHVAFDARPGAEICRALRAAGWVYRAGAWHGQRSTLPEIVAGRVHEVAPPAVDPAALVDHAADKRDLIAAAMRRMPGRNPAVVLRPCTDADDAPPVWSGCLADWLGDQDSEIVAAWDVATWRTVRDLSMGRRVMLYLGGANDEPLCALRLEAMK